MKVFFVTVVKAYGNAGRNLNKTYVNVVRDARSFVGTSAELVALLPWSNPAFSEFVVEVTEQQFKDFKNKVTPLFHDAQGNEPRFQYNQTTQEFGSWLDPEDDATTWQAGVVIPDDRLIVRIYDGPSLPANHVALIELDENTGPASQDFKTMNLKLFNSDDTPSATNTQNQKTLIANRLMIFDFTNGESDFLIDKRAVGTIRFESGTNFRVIGPAGEKEFIAKIYGRSLRVID